MKKEDVARVVWELSHQLVSEGGYGPWKEPYDVWIINPMAVWEALQVRRPDVAEHLRRHYRSDPYQRIKGWVPTQRVGGS